MSNFFSGDPGKKQSNAVQKTAKCPQFPLNLFFCPFTSIFKKVRKMYRFFSGQGRQKVSENKHVFLGRAQ